MTDISRKNRLITLGLIALAVTLLVTCRNPLTVGLGDKIDIDPPSLLVLSHSNGQYVTGTQEIGGSWEDDGTIESVTLSLDGGETVVEAVLDEAEGLWSLELDTNGFSDGETDMTITATDTSGKTISKNLLLFFDNRRPVVVVNNPQSYTTKEFNNDITIRGEAVDSSGISQVEIKLYDDVGNAVQLRDDTGTPIGSNTTAVDGTNAWSFQFRSAHYTLTAGDYTFVITATDKAGLTNTYIHHFDDILTLNGSASVTIEDLYKFIYGQSVSSISFTNSQLNSNQLQNLVLQIDQSLDLPTFEFNSPSVANPGLGVNAVAVGGVRDDDGINNDLIEISIDGGPFVNQIADTNFSVPDSGLYVSWEYDLAAVPEGSHTLEIQAEDIFGASDSSGPLNFVIDAGVPNIDLTAPLAGTYHNADILFTGTTSDGVGIDTVTVSIDNGPFVPVTTFDNGIFTEPGDGLKHYDWDHSYTVDAGGADDGSHVFVFRATDLSTKTFDATIQVFVDSTEPTVNFLAPSDASIVNGVIQVQGTTTDASPLTLLELTVDDGTTSNVYTLDTSVPVNEFDNDGSGNPSTYYSWYKDVDTRAYLDLAALTITAAETDAAGNTKSEVLTLSIDQATDLPEIFFDNIDIAAPASSNAFSGSPSLIGRVVDDDAVDTATVEINIDSGGWVDSTDPDLTVTGSGRSINWSYDMSGLTEGAHTVVVRADDVEGGQLSTSAPIGNFLLDLGAPDITITKIIIGATEITSSFQGTYVNGLFTVEGTATDGIEVASVEVNINNEVDAFLDPVYHLVDPGGSTSVNWTYDIDIAAIAEGDIPLKFRSIDLSGKTAFSDLLVIKDTTIPVVDYILPLPGATVNGNLTFTGTASDENTVTEVYLKVDGVTPGSDLEDWTLLSQKYSWNRGFNTRPYSGAMTAHVKSIDGAGNESIDTTINFSVDQATDKPVIAFDNLDPAADPIASPGSNLLSSSSVITGTITDDDGVDPATIEFRFSTDNGSTWSGWLDDADASFSFSGSGRNYTFAYDLSVNLEPEQAVPYKIELRATDIGGELDPVTSAPFPAVDADVVQATFVIDNGPPSLDFTRYQAGPVDITDPTKIQGSYLNTRFILSGTTFDGVGITEVRVTANSTTGVAAYNSGTGAWSFDTDTVPGILTGLPEGSTTVLVVAEDNFGKQTESQLQLIVDQTGPTVGYILPAVDATVNGTILIKGTTTDTNKVSAVDLYIGPDLVASINDSGSTFDGGSSVYSWEKTIDTQLYDAGPYLTETSPGVWQTVMEVTAYDGAGNASLQTDLPLTMDQTSDLPGISLSNVNPVGTALDNLFQSSPQIIGTATDDDGVSSIEISISSDGGSTWSPWTAVTSPVTVSGTTVSWSHDLSALSQGFHEFKVRVFDIVFGTGEATGNNTISLGEADPVDIAIDLDPPALGITSPGATSSVSVDTNIVGTASDLTGVTVEGDIDSAGSWTAASTADGFANWTFLIDVSAVGEGTHAYSIRATDGVGKTTTMDRQVTVDWTDPTVSVLSHADSQEVNKTITISGSASDTVSAIASVEWKAGVAGVYAPATGTYNWSIPAFDTTAHSDGILPIYIQATDAAGNSFEHILNLDIDQSTDLPVISVVNGEIITPTTAPFTFLGGQSYFAYGYVYDSNGVDAATLELQVDGGGWNPITNITDNGTHISWFYDLSGVGAGDFLVEVRGDDDLLGAAETIEFEVTSSTVNILSTNARFLGTTADDDGVNTAAMEVSVDGGAWQAVGSTTGAGTLINWEEDLSALADGPHTMELRAEDIYGETNASVPYSVVNPLLAYVIDTDPPDVTVTAPVNNSYTNVNFDVTGTSFDSNRVTLVEISFDSGSTWTAATPTGAGGSYSSWELLNVNIGAYGEGVLPLTARAVDVFGYETTKNLQIFIDTVDPTVTWLSPIEAATVNGDITLQGTSNDENLVDTVEWKIGAAGTYTTVGITGIYSWTIPLDTTTLPDAPEAFYLRATDRAGNTFESIRNLTVDQSSDIPQYSFSNIDEAGTAIDNLLESNPKIFGTATDDDGIASIEIQTSDDGGATWSGWTAVTDPAVVSGLSVNWYHDIAALGEGSFEFELRVRDDNYTGPATPNNEIVTPASIPFTVDLGAPVVDITEIEIEDPYTLITNNITGASLNGAYLNNEYILKGTVVEGTPGFTMEVSLDNGSTWANANVVGTNWDYTVPVVRDGTWDGNYSIKARATDVFAKSSQASLQVVVDTIEPDITIVTPSSGSNVNGWVDVRGTTSDVSPVDLVEMKIGAVEGWFAVTGTYNWNNGFESGNYAKAPDATDLGGNIWQLFVYLRAFDRAGNKREINTYELQVDPDGDAPIVNITQPLNAQNIGGPVNIYGTAFDDDAVFEVEMQIDVNGDADFADQIDLYDGVSGTPDGDTNDKFEDETQWYIVSGTNNWNETINQYGEMYHSENDRKSYIRVRAIDTKSGIAGDITGDYQEIMIQLDDTIPGIGGLLPANDTLVSGTFNLTANVTDNSRIDRIQISDDNGVTFTDILYWDGAPDYVLVPPYDTAGWVTINTQTDIDLDIPIDSTVDFPNTNGVYNYQLKVTDDTSPSPLYTIGYRRFFVDNNYPDGVYDADPLDINGDLATAIVSGTASDIGGGIDKVEVYFVRAGNVYRPDLSDTSVGIGTADLFSGDPGSVQTVDYTSDPLYKIIIDNETEQGNDAGAQGGDDDGYPEWIYYDTSIGEYRWRARFNSFNIPDGTIDLHYVVYDGAGNAHHYTEAAIIANFKPVIDTITVGADFDNSGIVVAGEQFAYTGGFSSRNLLYISIVTSEINISSYRIISDPWPYGTSQTEEATGGAGASYTTAPPIDISGLTDDDEALYGTPGYEDYDGTHFLYEVTNDVGVTTFGTITTTLKNADDIDPKIDLYPTTRTIDVTMDPEGLEYVPGSEPVLPQVTDGVVDMTLDTVGSEQGHVELDGESSYGGTDADLSGKIALRGWAWDNIGIDEITVSINGGAATTLAQWDPVDGKLESVDADFFIDPFTYPDPLPGTGAAEINTQVINQNGHTVEWVYYWDTSTLANLTGDDNTVVFSVTDFTNPAITDNDQYDVVPYISSIQRDPAEFNTNRSKYGKYPVQQFTTPYTPATDPELIINGYNLRDGGGGDWVRIYNTTTGGATFQTVSVLSDTPTSMTVHMGDITASGWLRLSVNNREAVNNLNNNTLDTNKEDDGNGLASTLWNDDRYIHIWDVKNQFTNSGNPEHPSMSINTTTGTLTGAWTNYADSDAYFANEPGGRTSFMAKYDPPEYTDTYIDAAGNRNIVYLGNYFNGGTNWGFLTVYTPNAPLRGDLGGGANHRGYYVEWLGDDDLLYQFQNARIVRNGDDIHVSYFDTNEKTMKYSYIDDSDPTPPSAGTDDDGAPAGTEVWLALDGGLAGAPLTGSTVALAGQYSAIDVDENNNPVIMYYDITNQTLRLAWANSATPTANNNWNIQDVFQGDDPYRTFAGKYVSMQIDAGGDIHAVFYRTSTGDLLYIHAADADGVNYSFDYAEIIDSEGAVGTWADLSLNGSTPYVSYINNSMAGTFDGVKIAYWDPALAGGSGDWEHEIIPASSEVETKRTSIEFSQGGAAWQAAIGYGSDNFELVYLRPQLP